MTKVIIPIIIELYLLFFGVKRKLRFTIIVRIIKYHIRAYKNNVRYARHTAHDYLLKSNTYQSSSAAFALL